MAISDFLKTKNTYYSGIAGAMGGLLGGKAWQSGLISATIATVDVACFPKERPAHIEGWKWFAGNLLSSTAVGLVSYGLGHGARTLFSGDDKPQGFARREAQRQSAGTPEKMR